MIALYDNIPYVVKAIKRLFLPHNFWRRLEIDCFENNQSMFKKCNTFVDLEPEGYFSREIMIVDGEIIPITEKYMEDLKRRRMICVKTFGKRVKILPPFILQENLVKYIYQLGTKNQRKDKLEGTYMQNTEDIKKKIIMQIEQMNERDHKFLLRLHIIITTHLKKTGK